MEWIGFHNISLFQGASSNRAPAFLLRPHRPAHRLPLLVAPPRPAACRRFLRAFLLPPPLPRAKKAHPPAVRAKKCSPGRPSTRPLHVVGLGVFLLRPPPPRVARRSHKKGSPGHAPPLPPTVRAKKRPCGHPSTRPLHVVGFGGFLLPPPLTCEEKRLTRPPDTTRRPRAACRRLGCFFVAPTCPAVRAEKRPLFHPCAGKFAFWAALEGPN